MSAGISFSSVSWGPVRSRRLMSLDLGPANRIGDGVCVEPVDDSMRRANEELHPLSTSTGLIQRILAVRIFIFIRKARYTKLILTLLQ